MRRFSPVQIAALRALDGVWRDHPFVLIGASALRCHFPAMRATLDLDVTLGASVDEVAVALREIGWTRHATKEHEWRAADGAKVDIIPAGARHLAAGQLAWSESGDVMSLVGFRHVFIAPRGEVVDAGLTVRVARAPILALLKMVAYMDRPLERTRDLGDLALLLQEYVHADDDRRFSDHALASGLSFENVPAFLLGRDLAGQCDARELQVVHDLIRKAGDPGDPHATPARLLRAAPASWRRDPAIATERLAALLRGIESD